MMVKMIIMMISIIIFPVTTTVVGIIVFNCFKAHIWSALS